MSNELNPSWDRRQWLQRVGLGAGAVAFDLIHALDHTTAPMKPRPPHFQGVKSVIWIVLNGGPSQVDTWDYKPELQRRHGQALREADPRRGFFETSGQLLASPFAFQQYGQSGSWSSEIFPFLNRQIDKLAFVHSCYSRSNNHSPALFEMNTGMSRMGFPCVGSWIAYGLGTENQNLPAFIAMTDAQGRGLPKNQAQNWGNGFLPSVFQGTRLKNGPTPVNNLRRSGGVSQKRQRSLLNLVETLNRKHQARYPDQSELSARIEAMALAFRMQTEAPDIFSIENESNRTRRLYGLEHPTARHFGRQCLLARKLVESGVRFIQIFSGGTENAKSWDGHHNIDSNHRHFAMETDQGMAALLQDLADRGLLESTLVICGGEFGRTSDSQKGGTGRDHNPNAFTWWFAGGNVRGGAHVGMTDEVGYQAVERRVNIHDLHATLLHCCGLDHEQLTYRFNGRDFRLTDVHGHVISELIASSHGEANGSAHRPSERQSGSPRSPLPPARSETPAPPGSMGALPQIA